MSAAPFATGELPSRTILAFSLNFYWDAGALEWVEGTQPGAGGGGAATIADGADVALGATSDAAVVTDTTGTVSSKLRGLVKWAFERMPTSLGQAAMAASFPVVVSSNQSAIPVSVAALPLPSGASTAALQTQPGVDIGDVTINNAAGGAAVNIQDGGNSITVDGTITADTGLLQPLTDAELRATPVAITGAISASSSATANEDDPEHTEGDAAAAFSQDLGGRLRTRNYGLISDAPEVYVPGDIRMFSLTTEGRLRVSTAEQRFAGAPFGENEESMWGDLRPWDNGPSKSYYDGSPWNAW